MLHGKLVSAPPVFGAAGIQGSLSCLGLHAPAEPNEELWQTQWEQWGSCAGFSNASDYFSFSLAAAQKYDANVSGSFQGVTAAWAGDKAPSMWPLACLHINMHPNQALLYCHAHRPLWLRWPRSAAARSRSRTCRQR